MPFPQRVAVQSSCRGAGYGKELLGSDQPVRSDRPDEGVERPHLCTQIGFGLVRRVDGTFRSRQQGNHQLTIFDGRRLV